MADSPEADHPLGMNQLKLEVSIARDELAETLDALEDKLNVAAKGKRAWRSVKRQYRDDPAPVLATAGVSAVAVVTAIVLIARGRRG